jgi:hypothetical protein
MSIMGHAPPRSPSPSPKRHKKETPSHWCGDCGRPFPPVLKGLDNTRAMCHMCAQPRDPRVCIACANKRDIACDCEDCEWHALKEATAFDIHIAELYWSLCADSKRASADAMLDTIDPAVLASSFLERFNDTRMSFQWASLWCTETWRHDYADALTINLYAGEAVRFRITGKLPTTIDPIKWVDGDVTLRKTARPFRNVIISIGQRWSLRSYEPTRYDAIGAAADAIEAADLGSVPAYDPPVPNQYSSNPVSYTFEHDNDYNGEDDQTTVNLLKDDRKPRVCTDGNVPCVCWSSTKTLSRPSVTLPVPKAAQLAALLL